MAILISRREVLNNIIRLKDRLLEDKGREERGLQKNRGYKALLNRKTGDIRFIKEEENFIPSEEWMEMRIQVEVQKNKVAHFDARDKENHLFQSRGIAPLALRIIAETLETLNAIASHHPSKNPDTLPEESALEDLSEIHLNELTSNIEDAPGWMGDIDRITAEAKLRKYPVGTYLLRHAGRMTQLEANGLSKSNQIAVKAYLITINDIDKKMAEQLILHTQLGWTIYRDNPDLKDITYYSYYNSFKEALRNLEPRAKTPLKDK